MVSCPKCLGHEPRAVQADSVMMRQVSARMEDCALAGLPECQIRRLDRFGRGSGGKGEVQTSTIEIAMTEMARCGSGMLDAQDRRPDVVEDALQTATMGRQSRSYRPRIPSW